MSETPRPDDWTAVLDAVSIYAPSGDAAQRVMRKVDAARAAEHEQHQREIAQRDETIRQLRARERELESAVDSAADLEPEAYEAWRAASPVPVAPQETKEE